MTNDVGDAGGARGTGARQITRSSQGKRGTYEELAEDGGETGQTETEEPGAESVDGESGVVVEGDKTESVVLVRLDRTLVTGSVEINGANVF